MDFYVKDLGDPNFDVNKVHSESELAQVLTQIETMLFTNKGDVMGSPDFGANLEDLVYSLDLNEQAIQSVVREQLDSYVPLAQKYNTRITVQFYKGNVRDIAQIDVILDSKYQVGVYIN
jgi:phage baseplate assembly protein W